MRGVEQRLADGLKEYTHNILKAEAGFKDVEILAEVTPPAEETHGHQPPPEEKAPPQPIPGVKKIIAVSSGKGGVGKSTVAVNLAVAAVKAGKKVGIMDADIHGPSLPTLLHIEDGPGTEGDRMLPVEKYGIKGMSIGFIVEPGQPLIWRGPMLNKALEQLLDTTKWGDLDVLFLDLPPGTGDVQISLSQKYRIDGAIVVTTPQNLALEDVRRGAVMFQHTAVPVIGIVENMSYYSCPNCGHESHPFGAGGGEKESSFLGIPLLGKIPLDPQIMVQSDSGEPVVLAEPEGGSAKSYLQVWENVSNYIDSK
ncbi:Mrp/NBP35 family ATP-binding protein [bacterium]|nr:Mrp/NBP35 family ATP-binding protein [bacterium]